MTLPDFMQKQIIFVTVMNSEKISFLNDNLIVKDKTDKVILQVTCFRILMLCIVGGFSFTSGIVYNSKKFSFPIYLLTSGLKLINKISNAMEGNVILRRHQYEYNGLGLAKFIVFNKVSNQLAVIESKRKKSPDDYVGITKLKDYLERINGFDDNGLSELLSLEGNAAKIYFKLHFDTIEWKGRKPRVKFDVVNSILDIGYSILFNFIECILDFFGFDLYCGVLHQQFFMRKSLVCDMVEPFRVIIDVQVKKSLNLKQFRKDDFVFHNGAYNLNWNLNKKYVSVFLEAILEYKSDIFCFILSYYRAFMKQLDVKNYEMFRWH